MNGSELLVKCLENEGVTHIFGVAGEENLPLLEAISKSKIKYISTRHEQAAAFMAATMGRLTGRPGVCLSTLGPGATNLTTGAAYAFLGGMPMVMLTGQKPIRERTQGNFQIIDAVSMFKPIVKYTRQVSSADMIPQISREAFRVAESEKPGPAHIELPKDISLDVTDKKISEPTPVRQSMVDDHEIEKAVKIITESQKPILLIGSGANRKKISKTLAAFIEKTGIPFLTTQMGKGAVDERSPYCLGTLAVSSRDYPHCALDLTDLVVTVGYDIGEKIPFYSKGAKILHINFFRNIENPYYKPDHEITGDINQIFSTINEKLDKKFPEMAEILKLKLDIGKKIYEKSDSNNFPVLPQKIVADVRKAMPDDGILCLDNGMYKLWFARGYQAYAPNTILLDNALATMGAGLPSAIAAKLLYPDKFIMAVVGDGGFMMSGAEMETAVRLKLDLAVLIINDNGFGMIEWEQKEKNYSQFGLRFGNPDFVKFAESFGARGARAQKAGDIIPLIEEARREAGVWVIEVPVDYSENIKVFTEALKNNKCQF